MQKLKNELYPFFRDVFKWSITGTKSYQIFISILLVFILIGAYAYSIQLKDGLVVTGMNDIVSWGLYIANFTFLVGIAAAAVMLVLPAYYLKDSDFIKIVLFGEAIAVAALVMCMFFVTADMGGPGRIWHMFPVVGLFNWPRSMLTWDVIVLNGYLLLNLLIPFYILYCHYHNRTPIKKYYVPFVLLSIFWATAIHLVTAYLYLGISARTFWNSALLGPRFLTSAFTAGPALIIIILTIIKKVSSYKIDEEIIKKLALIVTAVSVINLIMMGSELFKEFYINTHHSISAVYLYFGIDGQNDLVIWSWTTIVLNIMAPCILVIHRLRNKTPILLFCCSIIFISVWIEKGMGLIVPGFLPSSLGEMTVYTPSLVEIIITIGIWAIGALIFTMLTRVMMVIEQRYMTN